MPMKMWIQWNKYKKCEVKTAAAFYNLGKGRRGREHKGNICYGKHIFAVESQSLW